MEQALRIRAPQRSAAPVLAMKESRFDPAQRRFHDLEPMGHRFWRPRRAAMPHPVLMAVVVIIVIAALWLGANNVLQIRGRAIPIAIGTLVIFSYLLRRSARRQAMLRQQELEELRHKPVWGLSETLDETGDGTVDRDQDNPEKPPSGAGVQ